MLLAWCFGPEAWALCRWQHSWPSAQLPRRSTLYAPSPTFSCREGLGWGERGRLGGAHNLALEGPHPDQLHALLFAATVANVLVNSCVTCFTRLALKESERKRAHAEALSCRPKRSSEHHSKAQQPAGFAFVTGLLSEPGRSRTRIQGSPSSTTQPLGNSICLWPKISSTCTEAGQTQCSV